LPPQAKASRRRRIASVIIAVLLVLGVLALIGTRISTNDFAITPGSAQPVAPLIKVAGTPEPAGSGKILLTDVLLTQLNWTNYLWYRLDSNADIVPTDELIPTNVNTSQLNAQGYLEMSQSKEAAKTAALTRLGYHVTAKPDGAVVTQVANDAPAASAVSVADIISGVDGQPTDSACGVIRAVHDLAPGTKVTLDVRVATIHPDGAITNAPAKPATVTIGAPHSKLPSGCPGVSGPPKGYLGIGLLSDVHYTYPIPISISTPNIGGPSAGLAMTLGIIDELSGGTLVHHRTMAATGTISPNGAVGDVGGVPQKTVAVADAGATLFFVPTRAEKVAADEKAPASLKVTTVTSLDQALRALFALGGTIKLADGTVEGKTTTTTGS
jgi:Lon-like protease